MDLQIIVYNAIECDDNAHRIFESNSLCLCSEGFYDVGATVCDPCHYSCSECSGPQVSQCLSCPDASISYRYLSNNYCLCNKGYYDDNVSTNCKSCHMSCESCTTAGPSSCSSCLVS
jgi:hypothetical protein